MQEAMQRKFAAVRMRFTSLWPYLSTVAFSVPVVEVPEDSPMSTMAVDKYWRLYVNPKFLAEHKVEELASVFYHEMGHLIRAHSDRAAILVQDEAHKLWNLAADAEINDDIRSEQQSKLPEDAIYPSVIGAKDGGTAEEYYEHLLKNAKKSVCKSSGGACSGNCGSGADGNQNDKPWEKGAPGTPSAGGEDGLNKIQGDLLRKEVARQIQQASQKQGTVPAGWKRWAEEFLVSKVNWRKELSAQILSAIADVSGRVNYSYRRPGRRQSAMPQVVIPSMRQPVPEISVVVDTSGSMSDSMVGQALAEVAKILKHAGAAGGARIISCDAAIHSSKKVFNKSQVQLAGGGGTDMTLGIDFAMQQRPRPTIVIVITDMYTGWPAQKPNTKLVIVDVACSGGGKPPWPCKVIEAKAD